MAIIPAASPVGYRFVIVMAALRVFKVDYVTTIIDSAPFGVLFGVVVMSYVLSWLIEYWLNRVVGVELLQLLGSANDGAASPTVAAKALPATSTSATAKADNPLRQTDA